MDAQPETQGIGNLSEHAYSDMIKAGQVALEEELNLRVFRGRFAELIGVEADELVMDA